MAAQAYITRDEFFAQTVPGDAFSKLSNALIDQAILWASSHADSYLRKRYTLPLVVFSEDLKSAVAGIVQWRLMSRNGIRPGSGNEDISRLAFEDAIGWLKSIARGEVELDCQDSTPLVDEDGSLAESEEMQSFTFVTGPREDDDCCGDD